VRFVGETRSRQVVGVVADVRAHDLTRDEPEWIDGTLYVPHGTEAALEDGRVPADLTALIDTPQAADALVPQLQRLAAESGGLVIDDVRGLDRVVESASATPAATASVLAATAALALFLGSVGVYAVLSFLVSRRTREIGIRVALGALPWQVCRTVLREAAVLGGAGLAIGVAGALVTTRWLAGQLHGVSATDPATYAAVVVTIAVVTLLASLVPTRRAMRVDPLHVLRDS
jgi:ABC-type antimicrobial peptide transport system permease subunit